MERHCGSGGGEPTRMHTCMPTRFFVECFCLSALALLQCLPPDEHWRVPCAMRPRTSTPETAAVCDREPALGRSAAQDDGHQAAGSCEYKDSIKKRSRTKQTLPLTTTRPRGQLSVCHIPRPCHSCSQAAGAHVCQVAPCSPRPVQPNLLQIPIPRAHYLRRFTRLATCDSSALRSHPHARQTAHPDMHNTAPPPLQVERGRRARGATLHAADSSLSGPHSPAHLPQATELVAPREPRLGLLYR